MIVVAATIILALGGGALWYFLREDDEPQGQTDRITLVVPAVSGSFHESEPELLTSLSMTGGRPENAAFEISLMETDGGVLPTDGSYRLSAEITNLNDGSRVDILPSETVADASTPTWTVADVGIDTEGWWRVRTKIEPPDGHALRSEFFLLMPDPNMAGVSSPPAPETDPDAAATLDTALTNMSQWSSLRWWEWLSGGDGSIILVEFSVTTPDANGQPHGFQNRSLYAGRMVPDADGNPPAAPRTDHYTAVTIGEEAWQVQGGGTPESRPPARYLPIQQYPETYEGATGVQFGIMEEIEGRETQVVTFHVPTKPTQSEAWYAFWVDVETGEVIHLAMIAMNHYMIWEYFDVNEPFLLEFPIGVPLDPTRPTPAA